MTTTIITHRTGVGPARPASHRPRPAPAAGRRHRAVAAPNYAVRRVFAAALAMAAPLAVAAALAASGPGLPAGFGGAPAVASEASPASAVTAHLARPGDTLWSIAAEHRGDVDHRRYVEALIELNGGVSIEVGQAVRLP